MDRHRCVGRCGRFRCVGDGGLLEELLLKALHGAIQTSFRVAGERNGKRRIDAQAATAELNVGGKRHEVQGDRTLRAGRMDAQQSEEKCWQEVTWSHVQAISMWS